MGEPTNPFYVKPVKTTSNNAAVITPNVAVPKTIKEVSLDEVLGQVKEIGHENKLQLSNNMQQAEDYKFENDRRNSLINKIEESDNLRERLKSINQSWYNQGGNALAQAATTIVGQVVQGIGSIATFGERLPYLIAPIADKIIQNTSSPALYGGKMISDSVISDLIEKDAGDFDNMFAEFGRDIEGYGKENFPIYLMNKGKAFDMGSWAYLMSNVPSIASTLGLMIPAKGASTLAIKGLEALSASQKLARLSTASKLITEAKPLTKLLLKTGFEAAIMRDSENTMESYQAGEEMSKYMDNLSDKEYIDAYKYKNPEASDEEAIKNRKSFTEAMKAEAAIKTFQMDAINYFSDFVQMAALNGIKFGRTPLVTSDLYGKSIKAMEKEILRTGRAATKIDLAKNIAYRTGRTIRQQGIPEGMEEIINGISSKEGLHYGKFLIGRTNKDEDWQDRMINYAKDPHIWEQGFWGAVGGIGAAGGFKVAASFFNKEAAKATEKEQLAEIDSRQPILAALGKNIELLNKNINPYTNEPITGTEEFVKTQVENLRKELITDNQVSMVLRALRAGNSEMFIDTLEHKNTLERLVASSEGSETEVKEFLKEFVEITKGINKEFSKGIKILNRSFIGNEGVKNFIVGESIRFGKEKKYLTDMANKSSAISNKLITEDTFLNGNPDKEVILDAVDKLAKFQALEDLNKYIIDQKRKFKNNVGMQKLLERGMSKLTESLAEDLKDVNKEQMNKIVYEAWNSGMNPDIVHHKVADVFGSKFAEFKDTEIHASLHETTAHKEYEKGIIRNKKEEAEELKTDYNTRLKIERVAAIDKLNKLDKDSPDYIKAKAEIIRNAKAYLKKIMDEDAFENTGISRAEINLDLDIQAARAEAASLQTTPDIIEEVNKDEENYIKENEAHFSNLVNAGLQTLEINKEHFSKLLSESTDSEQAKEFQYILNFINKQIANRNKQIDNDINDAIEEADKEQYDDLQRNKKISDTGGESALNVYLNANKIIKFAQRGKNGILTIPNLKDYSDILELTMKYLQEGREITIGYATRQDFLSDEEFLEDYRNNKGKSIVGRIHDIPIMFINTKEYLTSELNTTIELLDNLDNKDLSDLFYALKELFNANASEETKTNSLNNIKDNKLFSKLFSYDTNDSENKAILERDLEHLKKILFFGINRNEIIFNKKQLNASLTDWYYKIKRDYENRDKIANRLETTNSFNTKIAYSSTGTLIIATNDSGEVQLLNLKQSLSDRDGETNFPLLVKEDGTDNKLVLTGTTTNGYPDVNFLIKNNPNFQFINNTGYKGNIFSAAKSANGDWIPVPLIQNKIKSRRTKKISKASEKRIEYIKKELKAVLALLNTKDDKGNHTVTLHDSRVDEIRERLRDIVIVNRFNDNKVEPNLFLKIHAAAGENTAHVEFPTEDGGIYQLYMNEQGQLSLYKDKVAIHENEFDLTTGENLINDKFQEELNNGLSNLTRSFSYSKLKENLPFVDPITNKKYTSYRQYLIDSEAVLTYIGKVQDADGNKISNFMPKPNNDYGTNRPLIVNIETDASKTTAFTSGEQVVNSLLNTDYEFVLNKMSQLGVRYDTNFRPATNNQRGGFLNGVVYYTELLNQDLARSRETVIHEMLHGIIAYSPIQKELLRKRIEEFNSDLLKDINTYKEIMSIISDTTISEEEKTKKLKIYEEAKVTFVQDNIKDLTEFLNVDIEIAGILKKIDATSEEYIKRGGADFEETITYAYTNKSWASLLAMLPSDKVLAEQENTFWQRLKNLVEDLIEKILGNNKLNELTNTLDDIFRETNPNQSINATETTVGTETGTSENTTATNTATEDDDILDGVLDNIPRNNVELFDNVDYKLKSVEILQSAKGDEIFRKGDKNNWDIDKILLELNIPKEQKELIKTFNTRNREEILTNLLANYSYTVEINTAKQTNKEFGESQGYDEQELTERGIDINRIYPTQYYSNLTVSGGTNYTENEIATPLITPSIKGHAQFATDKGIGWFRSDDASFVKQAMSIQNKEKDFEIAGNKYTQEYSLGKGFQHKKNGKIISEEEYRKAKYSNSKTRRILEVQSDLFQKGRDKENLVQKESGTEDDYENDNQFYVNNIPYYQGSGTSNKYYKGNNIEISSQEYSDAYEKSKKEVKGDIKQNQFLQLLNKDSNWVTFFVKSIIQDSAKKGYEKVLFPRLDTIIQIESAGKWKTYEEAKKAMKDNRWQEIDQEYRQVLQEQQKEYSKNPTEKLKQLIVESKERIASHQPSLLNTAKFYQNDITNILNKQYGKENVKQVTDEYGNTWNEIEITPEVKTLTEVNLFDNIERNNSDKDIKEKNQIKDLVSSINNKFITPYQGNLLYEILDSRIQEDLLKEGIDVNNFYTEFNKELTKNKPSNWFTKIIDFIKNLFNKKTIDVIYKDLNKNEYSIVNDKTSFILNNVTNERKEKQTIVNKILFRSIVPVGYTPNKVIMNFPKNLINGSGYKAFVEQVPNFFNRFESVSIEQYKKREDAWRISNRLPQVYDTFVYKGKGKLNDKLEFIEDVNGSEFYYIKDFKFNTKDLQKKANKDGIAVPTDNANLVMGNYALIQGKDDIGNYFIYKDVWDLELPKQYNKMLNEVVNQVQKFIDKTQTPFTVQDKIYKSVSYDNEGNPVIYYTKDTQDEAIKYYNELEEYVSLKDNVISEELFNNIEYNKQTLFDLEVFYKLRKKDGTPVIYDMSGFNALPKAKRMIERVKSLNNTTFLNTDYKAQAVMTKDTSHKRIALVVKPDLNVNTIIERMNSISDNDVQDKINNCK